MLAILAPILVFGLVIFVHELGHFLAAKAVGVYAPRFSIGFGPSIFRFRRGETSEPDAAGLGLGLWIVRSIVERHAGSVRVERTPESRTRFVMTLPMTPGAPENQV
jgi:light-regulated signal transduction histidine kinase (bacteriophytochrome)